MLAYIKIHYDQDFQLSVEHILWPEFCFDTITTHFDISIRAANQYGTSVFWYGNGLSSTGVRTEGKKYGNKKITNLVSIVFLFALSTNSEYLLKWSQRRSILANFFLIEMTETQPPLSQE